MSNLINKNKKEIQVTWKVSGRLAELIRKEAEQIEARPGYWLNKHFYEYFKLDKKKNEI